MSTPRVLVVEHEESCPPAHLADWLVEEGCRVEVCRPYAGDPLPGLDRYDGLVLLGGSMSATDPDVAWLAPVQALVLDADAAGVPTLGICLGHQLCALAFGATVGPNPHGQQLGVLDVGWLGPMPHHQTPSHPAVFWNDDVVTALPPGAEVLARTPRGELQAVRWSTSVWSVQWHPEVDVDILRTWAVSDAARHAELGVDQDAVLAAVAAAGPALAVGARRIAADLADRVRRRHDPAAPAGAGRRP